jgi:glutamate---cysteine ligase / carboxylate-amine ligase
VSTSGTEDSGPSQSHGVPPSCTPSRSIPTRIGLFEAFGVELEYMLVDSETLDVRPAVDALLAGLGGRGTCDHEDGPVTWSNELAAHVIELKTTAPEPNLCRLTDRFEQALQRLQPTLDAAGLILLPTAMHPWMDPAHEGRLWPHEGNEIYQAFDRIFDCRRHGWMNVQSVHLNLPFATDEEFAALHAAVRLVLPLLPALAASSPACDGRISGVLDTRMQAYATHGAPLAHVTGELIPEPVYDEASYRREIFAPLAAEIAPLDPAGILQEEFLNARGAIARFQRGSIELRVMDVQEHPAADVAICTAVAAVVRALVEQRWQGRAAQQAFPTASLAALLQRTIRHADHAEIDDPAYLAHFGVTRRHLRADELWERLLGELRRGDPALDALFGPLEEIFCSGTLARRILAALGQQPTRGDFLGVYRELADCLRGGESFVP